MFSFIARRVGLLIPTFFGITLLTFALIRMIPGDPVEVMMGERRVDPEMHAQAMERLDDFGTVEAGKIADLLLLSEDPTRDVRAFRTLTHVMRAGVLREQASLAWRPAS